LKTSVPVWTLAAPASARAGGPEEVPLWPAGAPGAVGNEAGDVPTLTIFRPDPDKATAAWAGWMISAVRPAWASAGSPRPSSSRSTCWRCSSRRQATRKRVSGRRRWTAARRAMAGPET